MGPLAHLRLFCDHCGQETSAFIADGVAGTKVTCEHCQHVFDYVAGMMCEHVGTVAEIPAGARMTPPPQRSDLLHQVQYTAGPRDPSQPPPIPNYVAAPTVRAVSGWLIAWCIFCLVVHGLNILGTLIIARGGGHIPTQAQMTPATMVIAVGVSCVAIVGLALILMARKVGFYLMCFVAVIALITNLAMGNHYGFFSPLGPLITWLLMRKGWPRFK